MNHHFFVVHPCPCGTRKGNHEHERTVRATIIIVIPFSAFLRVDASIISSASVARHHYKNNSWLTCENLLRFGLRSLILPHQALTEVAPGSVTPFQDT
jgi:hypothetical protein